MLVWVFLLISIFATRSDCETVNSSQSQQDTDPNDPSMKDPFYNRHVRPIVCMKPWYILSKELYKDLYVNCTHIVFYMNKYSHSLPDELEKRDNDEIQAIRRALPYMFILPRVSTLPSSKKTRDLLLKHFFDGLFVVWDSSASMNEKLRMRDIIEDLRKPYYYFRLLMVEIDEEPLHPFTIAMMKYGFYYVYPVYSYYNYVWKTYPHLTENPKMRTVEGTIQNLLDEDIFPAQILMPLPFIGLKTNKTELNFDSVTYWSYGEICLMCKQPDWTESYDEERKITVTQKGNLVIYYHDLRNIIDKVSYVRHHKLGGVLVFHPPGDDLDGRCGLKSPLMNVVMDELVLYVVADLFENMTRRDANLGRNQTNLVQPVSGNQTSPLQPVSGNQTNLGQPVSGNQTSVNQSVSDNQVSPEQPGKG